jgi:hypothetical protein
MPTNTMLSTTSTTSTTSTVPTDPGRHDHPPEQPRLVRRVTLIDRAALHLGVALITWGRRPLAVETRERRARRVVNELARASRERESERALRLIAPVR